MRRAKWSKSYKKSKNGIVLRLHFLLLYLVEDVGLAIPYFSHFRRCGARETINAWAHSWHVTRGGAERKSYMYFATSGFFTRLFQKNLNSLSYFTQYSIS